MPKIVLYGDYIITINGENWSSCETSQFPRMMNFAKNNSNDTAYYYVKCLKCSGNAIPSVDPSTNRPKWLTTNFRAIMCADCGYRGDHSAYEWVRADDKCEHCNGSGVGWNHLAGKEIANGCTHCNGSGIK